MIILDMLESEGRRIREAIAADIENFLDEGHRMDLLWPAHSCRPNCSYISSWLWEMLDHLRRKSCGP